MQHARHLEQTNFIQSYIPFDKKHGEYYKVIDEFCLFYLSWLAEKKNSLFANDYWIQQTKKPVYQVWTGYAFEAICYKHTDQIIHALNIKSADTIPSWRLIPKNENEEGSQIDLLVDRSDNSITLCEIKYTNKPFIITKQYAEILRRKIETFKKKTQKQKNKFS